VCSVWACGSVPVAVSYGLLSAAVGFARDFVYNWYKLGHRVTKYIPQFLCSSRSDILGRVGGRSFSTNKLIKSDAYDSAL
jgi:hypothetical protein